MSFDIETLREAAEQAGANRWVYYADGNVITFNEGRHVATGVASWNGYFMDVCDPETILNVLDELEELRTMRANVERLGREWAASTDALCCNECQSAVQSRRDASDDLFVAMYAGATEADR